MIFVNRADKPIWLRVMYIIVGLSVAAYSWSFFWIWPLTPCENCDYAGVIYLSVVGSLGLYTAAYGAGLLGYLRSQYRAMRKLDSARD